MPALEAKDSAFFLDGREIKLLSGAIHYFRVIPEYWEDRLLKLKACGLNCVETLVSDLLSCIIELLELMLSELYILKAVQFANLLCM